MNRCSTGGVSLAEVLIASAMMGVLLLVVHSLVQNGARYVRRAEAMLDVQQESLTALAWLASQLKESNEDMVRDETVGGEIPGIIFPSPRDLDGYLDLDAAGRLLWHKMVAVYLDEVAGRPCLVLKERAIEPTPALPQPPPLADLVNDTSVPVRVLARNVVVLTGDDPDTPPFDVGLQAQVLDGSKRYGVRVQTSVFFRN